MLLDCYKDPGAFWSTARIQWKSRERQFFLCHLGTRGLACIPELDLGYSKLGICLNFAIPIEGFYFLVNSRRHEVVVVVVVGGGGGGHKGSRGLGLLQSVLQLSDISIL